MTSSSSLLVAVRSMTWDNLDKGGDWQFERGARFLGVISLSGMWTCISGF